jgi:hypothetical protein
VRAGPQTTAVLPAQLQQMVVFVDKMEALLRYWETRRRDPITGLYVWHDQLGACSDTILSLRLRPWFVVYGAMSEPVPCRPPATPQKAAQITSS